MITDVKAYQFKCDGCGLTRIVYAASLPSTKDCPKGWIQVSYLNTDYIASSFVYWSKKDFCPNTKCQNRAAIMFDQEDLRKQKEHTKEREQIV